MMYAIYRLSDGVIVKHFTGPARQLERNIPDGCAAYEGEIDPLLQRIDPETRLVVQRADVPASDWQLRAEQELAREAIAKIEAGQIRTIREALLGDADALERLREQEPAIVAAREVLQRRPTSSAPSGQDPAASEVQPEE